MPPQNPTARKAHGTPVGKPKARPKTSMSASTTPSRESAETAARRAPDAPRPAKTGQ